MSVLKRFLSILLIVFVLSSSLVFADGGSTDSNITIEESTVVEQFMEFLDDYYRFDVDKEKIYREALIKIIKENPELFKDLMESAMANLDAHSAYFTQEEFEGFMSDVDQSFVGIGIYFDNTKEGIKVLSVIDNSPAQKAGIILGDLLVSCDGKSLKGISVEEARAVIRGLEGSLSIYEVYRGSSVMSVEIKREVVYEASAYYEKITDKIGYLRLTTFGTNTPKEVDEALAKADLDGITNIILDLRNNGGGSVDACLKIAQHFIPEGDVVKATFKNSNYNRVYSSFNENPKYKLAVLINEYSASASEILAGAVRDRGVGVLVGTKTYGKGTMQMVYDFGDDGVLKLTTVLYQTPSGEFIDGYGIRAGIYVPIEYIGVDKEKLSPLDYYKHYMGETGTTVLGAKQRLKILGYYKGEENDVFDQELFDAVASFQGGNELFSYGGLDTNTQLKIEGKIDEFKFAIDTQKKSAIDYFEKEIAIH